MRNKMTYLIGGIKAQVWLDPTLIAFQPERVDKSSAIVRVSPCDLKLFLLPPDGAAVPPWNVLLMRHVSLKIIDCGQTTCIDVNGVRCSQLDFTADGHACSEYGVFLRDYDIALGPTRHAACMRDFKPGTHS